MQTTPQAAVFDDRACELGEGALWHPERGQLFWFDILGRRLLTRNSDGPREWRFDEMCSAAGWIDRDTLLIASEHRLFRFDLTTGRDETICGLEGDNPATRSNDGRADPYGGFWIGTMGKSAETGAGSIWRFYRGALRRLFDGITITNAICFTPDRREARFADTRKQQVMRVPLDGDGWPADAPGVFLDLSRDGLNPDGAVIDASGTMWIAQWGAGRVAGYDAEGRFLRAIAVPGALQASCPAFGGPDLGDLFVTTAAEGLSAAERRASPMSGMTFRAGGIARGQAEHRVVPGQAGAIPPRS